MFASKTAIGIDISNGWLNLALLKCDKDGFKLLKSAGCPVPEGVVKDGNLEDPKALGKAIKKLRAKNNIPSCPTAISLCANPVLMQLMYRPKPIPPNLSQFLLNEVRQYAVLPDKDIAMDYCGIGSTQPSGGNRLFVVATDSRKVMGLIKACCKAGLVVESIEPSLFAYTRLFYDTKISGKSGSNVLMVTFENGILTLCVFRKTTVDFVRTKAVSEENRRSEKLCRLIAEEINEIIQFYDIEVPNSSRKWEISLITDDSVQLSVSDEKSLRAEVPNASLDFINPENLYEAVPAIQFNDSQHPCPAAIGLAMKLLSRHKSILNVNLLPSEISKLRVIKKDTLLTANFAAVVLFSMIVAVGVLAIIVKKVDADVAHNKEIQSLHNMRLLVEKHKTLTERINSVSNKLSQMTEILSLHHNDGWSNCLNEIRYKIPKEVSIKEMFTLNKSHLTIEGQALSTEAVNLFVELLNKSVYINSASLAGTRKESDKLINYTIDCAVIAKR